MRVNILTTLALLMVAVSCYSQLTTQKWYLENHYSPPNLKIEYDVPEMEMIHTTIGDNNLSEILTVLIHQINDRYTYLSEAEVKEINNIVYCSKFGITVTGKVPSQVSTKALKNDDCTLLLNKYQLAVAPSDSFIARAIYISLVNILEGIDKSRKDYLTSVIIRSFRTYPYSSDNLNKVRTLLKTTQAVSLTSAFTGKWVTNLGDIIFVNPEVIAKSKKAGQLLNSSVIGYFGPVTNTRKLIGTAYEENEKCIVEGHLLDRKTGEKEEFKLVLSEDRQSISGEVENISKMCEGVRITQKEEVFLGNWKIDDNSNLILFKGFGSETRGYIKNITENSTEFFSGEVSKDNNTIVYRGVAENISDSSHKYLGEFTFKYDTTEDKIIGERYDFHNDQFIPYEARRVKK